VVLALVMIIGLTGLNTKAKGARFIDNSSDNLITFMTDIWPSLPILYDVPLYGESLSRSIEDGGRPSLTSNIIMTVTGWPGDQIYLRNRIYARPGETAQAVTLSELSPGALIPDGSRKIPIRIRTDYINMVPFTENTIVLDMGEEQYSLNSKEKTLLPEPALFMDDTYVLIEERDREYPLVEDLDELQKFLNPSLNVTENMEQLAAELKGENPIQTVRNIRTYLSSNFTYTLNTEEDDNYTERFLFTSKEGYCLHFASAFVALARLNEIPCRFVEGYLVNFPSEEDFMENYATMPTEITTGVSGLSSHIWPEIYLYDRGWVSFEVTAPFVRGDSLTSEDRLTRRQLSEIQGSLISEEDRTYFWEQIPPFVYPVLVLLILIILLYPRFKIFLSKRINHSSHIVNRYIRLARRNGISLPQERGWIIWEREITLNIRGAAEVMTHSMPLILRSRYTNEELSHEDKETLKKGIAEFKSVCKGTRRS
jgi:transglutaminase-like putative cysteine protease